MKISRFLTIIAALAFVVGCQKPQTEADRKAEIDKEVQQRLDAEHQAAEQQRLAQKAADLDAREKALADKQSAATTTATTAPRSVSTSSSSSTTETAESYDTFYRKLEPYGAWRETADYGYVWQPRAAQQSRNWRPYTDGRWAYTDAGWTWISEEPFGWATYHYGRWARLSGVGWVWVPGDEWAPAWVSWRKSDQYVGWAPLPPEAKFEHRTGIKHWADNYYDIDAGEYVFIPNEDIGAENIESSVVPPERSVTIVNQSTNVTNITYSNTTIVNEGPNYDELRAHSRRPLERMRIERRGDAGSEAAPRPLVRGDVLSIVAPVIAAHAGAAPRTHEPRLERTAPERRNDPEAERARAKMKSEATPPPDAPPRRFERPQTTQTSPPAAATQAATAAPFVRTTPAPTATAVATATPAVVATATPQITPRSTATPIATATPSISVAPTATPRLTSAPLATATPSAIPAMTPRPTAPVTATRAPLATPTSTVSASVSPTAAAAEQLERRRNHTRDATLRQLGVSPSPATQASPPDQVPDASALPSISPAADNPNAIQPLHQAQPPVKRRPNAPKPPASPSPTGRTPNEP